MIDLIFIVPYRDRLQHKFYFDRHMKYLLEDEVNYEIIFVHQKDNRLFNRGAIKNIGFIYAKKKYPNDYKKITFVFNDIDTLPYKKKLLNYRTKKNIIKHFYGFEFCLGGIFSITGYDFEKINGFPCFWNWGLEDNSIYLRALDQKMIVDRSTFYRVGDMNILHLFDGLTKLVNKRKLTFNELKNINDGFKEIYNLNYTFNKGMLNVTTFDCNTIIYEGKNINIENINSRIQQKNNRVPQLGKMF